MLSVACILTGWKRNYFAEQLAALRAQSYPIEAFFLWHNGQFLAYDELSEFCDGESITLVSSKADFGYLGRYALPLLLPYSHYFVIDDDVIPGENYLSEAARVVENSSGIAATRGATLAGDWKLGEMRELDYTKLKRINHPRNRDVEVDIFLNGSLVPIEILRTAWGIEPPRRRDGSILPVDDIHISVAASLQGKKVIVPQQASEHSRSITQPYGQDSKASWKTRPDFQRERVEAFNYYFQRYGWTPQGWRDS